ncbi:MAG: hypothetical protein CMF54_08110 [Legionellales bacterium]|nr:hypothetical protein [Legionellales bacterium]|tara:strand:+ start:5380 stop:5979 length:600 start_codon:yes stop_codon:yes gene_type:complete
MNLNVPGIIYLTFLCLLISQNTFSSDGGASMSDKDINNVSKTDVVEKDDKERLSKAASLLTNYEIEAKKLLEMLKTKNINSKTIQNKAKDLLSLSEVVIESAQFRLPQCNEYLTKTLAIKTSLEEISHETLEKDYHHDGALPKAPGECYHTKDLFIHPATVYVLVRDDPSLQDATKSSINAEITEVLAHTELVRRLVIY